MPRLIDQANPIQNFGEFLPTPHIEKVYAYNDNLQIQLAIYLRLGDDGDAVSAQTALENLNIYLTYTTDADTFTEIQKGTESIFDRVRLRSGVNRLFESIKFSEFVWDGAESYDGEGFRSAKYTTTLDFPPEDGRLHAVWQALFWNTFTEFYLMSFSSLLNEDAINNLTGNIRFLNKQKSDIAYEVVIQNGELTTGNEIAYIDEAENVYSQIPLQAPSGKYHKVQSLSRSTIVDYFNELASEYTTAAESDDSLQSVVNSVLYVLSVYEEDAQLLSKLNQVVNAFPSKTSADTIGTFYERMRERQLSVNTALSADPVVTKKLIRNSKIINKAEVEAGDYTQPTEISYDDSSIVYSDTKISAESWTDLEMGKNFGFFFVDYEKVMYTQTNLSKIWDVSKIETYFGTSLTNQHLQFNNGYITRNVELTDGSWYPLLQFYITFDDDVSYPKIEAELHIIAEYIEGVAYDSATISGVTNYSYIAPISFNLASENGLDGYRLMGFEIQDYFGMGYTPTSAGVYNYEIKINFEDHSLQLMESIIDNYRTLKDESLQQYLEYAQEFCSYNNIDGGFNTFFAEGIKATYSSLSAAPWYQAPILYSIHRDLLFNESGGDRSNMLNAARNIIDTINPDTGTLSELETFVENFQDLYDTFYADDAGTIAVLLEAMSESATLAYTAYSEDLNQTYYLETPEGIALEEVIGGIPANIVTDLIYYSTELKGLVASIQEDREGSSYAGTFEDIADTSDNFIVGLIEYVTGIIDAWPGGINSSGDPPSTSTQGAIGMAQHSIYQYLTLWQSRVYLAFMYSSLNNPGGTGEYYWAGSDHEDNVMDYLSNGVNPLDYFTGYDSADPHAISLEGGDMDTDSWNKIIETIDLWKAKNLFPYPDEATETEIATYFTGITDIAQEDPDFIWTEE